MGTIFKFSSQVAEESKKSSSKIVTKVVETLNIKENLTEAQEEDFISDLTFVVRKGAHFTIYALLGIFVFLLSREYNMTVKKSVIVAVIVSMLYACSDEFHQCFVEGRSGEIRDVIIDTCGAFAGSMLALLGSKVLNRFKAKLRRKHNEL